MKPKLTNPPHSAASQLGNFLPPAGEIREKAEHAPRSGRDAVTGETRIAPQDTDELLLRRAAKGDEEAFALLYRRHLSGRDQLALAFYSAAALPVVVAITQVGIETHQMTPQIAAALIGAGMISLLVYPQLALTLRRHVPLIPVPAGLVTVNAT